jgi:RND family efflux transporter MFP subunit
VADAQAGLAEARAALTAAETVASRSTVRATFDGVVAERHHNPGDLVEATASDAVLRVIDPRRLEVIASVPLPDVTRVQVGAAARIVSMPVDTAAISLKVASVPAAVEAGTATVPVRLSVTSQVPLPVGTPVQVDIDAEQHRGVVLVPTAAVVRDADETAVLVARDNTAQRRPVRLGIDDGMRVEVVSGVSAGDVVIVDGQAGLPDAAAISIRAPVAEGEPSTAKDERP